MWIERKEKKDQFKQHLKNLSGQVIVVRGARQVGKTSFINNCVKELSEFLSIKLNLAYHHPTTLNGEEYFGRDYFGQDESARPFLFNLSLKYGNLQQLEKPIIVFIDEADRHPVCFEAIQHLAGLSKNLKIIFTGSNLENVKTTNAATGRKNYFDLYPITFEEFLLAQKQFDPLSYLQEIVKNSTTHSSHYHNTLNELFEIYARLGGMPKVLSIFLEGGQSRPSLPQTISDLANSIEENVKIVLGEKSRLYEYEDVLRNLALCSMDTLKFSRLQVQHAGRSEAKKLVNKTVGARVAHKIRLMDDQRDLSKYVIFDTGILNYLLNGSDLLNQKMSSIHRGILSETVVAQEIISHMITRDDLFYWKSPRGAQVDFIVKAPAFSAIDVKATTGSLKSLDSCAVLEKDVECLVRIDNNALQIRRDYIAKLPNTPDPPRPIPLLSVPHYTCGRLHKILNTIFH